MSHHNMFNYTGAEGAGLNIHGGMGKMGRFRYKTEGHK